MSKWVSTAVNVGPTLFAAEVRGHRLFGDVPEALQAARKYPLVVIDGCRPRCASAIAQGKGLPVAGSVYVADVIAQSGKGCAFAKLGLPDCYSEVGYPEDLYCHYKIDADGIIDKVRLLLGRVYEADEDWEDEVMSRAGLGSGSDDNRVTSTF